jgi:hypothetical protein
MGNARHKLNVSYLNGSLLIATLFGAVAESWTVFLLALAITAGCGFYSGEIRPSRTGRGR